MRISRFIDKETLRQLSTINNSVAWRHLLLRLALAFALMGLLFLTQHNLLLLAVNVLLLGFVNSFWGYAGYAHELFHRRVFSSRRLNNALFRFATAITWNNRAFFEASHLRHHSNTFSEEDDEGHSFQNWSRANVLRYAFFDYTLLWRKLSYTVKNAGGVIPNAFGTLKPQIQRAATEILIINGVIYLALWLLSHSGLVVAAWFVAQFSCHLPNRMLAQAQHLGLKQHKENGPLSHSRTLVLPGWLAFLYANMNYHCEHHLMPSIPYYHLPAMNRQLKAVGMTFEETNMNYLFHTFWQDVSQQQRLASE